MVTKRMDCVPFSGRKANWIYWSTKFESCCAICKFEDVVTGEEPIPSRAVYLAAKAAKNPSSNDI